MDTAQVGSEAALLRAARKRLFVGGRWIDGHGGVVAVEDPASGSSLYDVSDATDVDARVAMESAVSAQTAWACTPSRARSEILRRAFETLWERAEEIALLISLESGKPLGGPCGQGLETRSYDDDVHPRGAE